MYGLINEAMRRHVTDSAGGPTWARIAERAGTPETFAGLHYYDDDVTYALVGAASIELDLPAAELLRGFGRYWSNHVGPESYGDIMGATGTDVASVLTNLDAMHARIQILYPELRPPSFSVRQHADGILEVDYRSDRKGMAPFVVGLLEGLGELYGTPAAVVQIGATEAGQSHDTFLVRLGG